MAHYGSFGMFPLSSATDMTVNDPGVDSQGRALRQRRHHAKSRKGCMNCKSRKVKCDEQRPTCRKCYTGALKCDFDQSVGERQLTSFRDGQGQRHPSSRNNAFLPNDRTRAYPLGAASGRKELGVPTFDLESLQLFHHFEHFTSGTLLFGDRLWRDQIIPLALQHEYLMHAILMISASHLHYLQPQIHRHSKASAVHLDRTLSGFRSSLSGINQPHQHVDVVIACGFILLHYAWSVPYFNMPNEASPSVESDGLLWFAAGVKAVILTAYEKEPRGRIFHEYMRADHVKQFYAWSEQEDCLYDFEENFLRQTFPAAAHKVPEGDCLQRGCGNTNAGERLVPIFRAVDAVTRGQDISDVMPSILAYSLMWPSKAMQAFQDEVKDKDPGAMITMLSFYASSWLVLSKRAWWAHHRSKIMCESLLAHLTRENLGHWQRNVSKISEYFGFCKNHQGSWVVENPTTILHSSAIAG